MDVNVSSEKVSKNAHIGLKISDYLKNTLNNTLCFVKILATIKVFSQQENEQLIVGTNKVLILCITIIYIFIFCVRSIIIYNQFVNQKDETFLVKFCERW